MRLLELVSQHFDLPAQPRHLGANLLHLVEKIDESLTLELRLERGKALLELALNLRKARVRVGDPLARFVVVEERSMGRAGDE